MAVEAPVSGFVLLRRLAKRAARAEECEEGVGDGADPLFRRLCDVWVGRSWVVDSGRRSDCDVGADDGVCIFWVARSAGGR